MRGLPSASSNRITSIDLLRGIVMVIMALDHTRDFFHIQAITGNATDMATTTPQLFFTRWITHFCAPVFIFLAGTSAYLVGLRKGRRALSAFLLKRGIWLIVVEVVIMTLGITFDPFYHNIILQVIWVTALSMVVLGLVVRLPYTVILSIGMIIVIGHNLADFPEATHVGKFGFLWDLAHHGRFAIYPLFASHMLIIVYPFFPWLGVMMLGYCFGKLYENGVSIKERKRILLQTGFAITVLFVILRAINVYGDPFPWSAQRNELFTFLSFLNVTKYPPSLMYLCMTLGPAIIALALLEKTQNAMARFFTVYGRVPFFYYVVHFYVLHALTVVMFYASGYGAKDIYSPSIPFNFRPGDFGFSLPWVYVIWLAVVFALYPACRWYGRYKATHRQWWLSYT